MQTTEMISRLEGIIAILQGSPNGDSQFIVFDGMDNWDAECMYVNNTQGDDFDIEMKLESGYYVSYDEELVE